MLREQQIDLRRQRARAAALVINNLGKNRVFSTFEVTNPASGGRYEVIIRGFELGDNTCSCPDFRVNTLGTCKHIEAVLEKLRQEVPPHLLKRKAAVTHPEMYLRYGEQLQLVLLMPPRRSDQLERLAADFFDEQGVWSGRGSYRELIAAIDKVPESVLVRSDALDFIDREIEREEMLRKEQEWLARLDAGTLDWPLLRQPLYDYQMRGAIFLACRGRSILGDDMGLGKTVQTLAAMEILARERGVRRVLIVAPASVKYQWETEIRRFTDRTVRVVDGDRQQRQQLYAADVFYLLVNYEQVVRDREAINAWQPDVVVLDEAQRIKNWEAKTTQAVKKLRSRYAVVLTGTPLENKLEELYSIVQFVDERRFGPAFQFLHDHRILDEKGRLKGYRNLELIRERLAPIFLRRTRAEVLQELPPRTENVVFVELTPQQRQPYDEQRTTLARLLQKNHLTELDRKRILASLVQMRMICDSLFLFDRVHRISPKLDEFAELIPELLGAAPEDGGHKIIVFSQWEAMIHEAARVLDGQGIEYVVLHGGLSGPQRREVLEQFQSVPSCRVFLSTDAGGTGLNLQVADTVVNLELPWNPAVLEQRIARVHRMGQARPVRVIHLVARNTIEERVLRVLESKKSLFAGIFEGDSDEIPFTAFETAGFVEAVRELVEGSDGVAGGEGGVRPSVPLAVTASAGEASAGSVLPFWQGVMHLLEAAVQVLQTPPTLPGQPPLPSPWREHLRQAARRLLDALERPAPTSPPVRPDGPNGIME